MKNRLWSGILTLGVLALCLYSSACAGVAGKVVSGSGGGGSPAVTLSVASLTFASQTVKTTSAAQSVTLTNSGTATLNITSITITGTNSGDFAQTNTCGSTVAASATCTISVTFTPTAAGSRTASVSITDDATGSPQTVSLTGTGTSASGGSPAVTLSVASLTFASQTVNTTSAAQSVTLTNSGTATLNITSITITGTNSGDFAQTNTCGSTVAASATCTISVTFTPTAAGSRTASVSITDDATGSPQTVSLTGTGTSASGGSPAVTLSVASLTFASQTVNTTSAAQSVTLTNSGTASLSVTSVAITGTNSGDFAQTNTCGSTVAANATCTISVTFTPTAAGSRTASVSVTDNATGSPHTISLTGTGASAGTLSVTTTTLPDATTGKNYMAFLNATGGTTPYKWSIAAGSALPGVLTLDSMGKITGTDPGATGSASFTVQVIDSGSPTATATQALTLTIGANKTMASCNTIFINTDTKTPTIPPFDTSKTVVPVNDLGAGTYTDHTSTTPQVWQGGTFPGGGNVRPAAFDTTGVNLGNAIKPLAQDGTVDTVNGKTVLISIGMSNTQQESSVFQTDLASDTSVNAKLVFVNGAQGGADSVAVSDINNQYWTTHIPSALSANNVTAKQVVAVWLKEARAGGSDIPTLQSDLEKITQIIQTTFPNVKLVYVSSRIYAGYATDPLNPEYFAYESGFAVKAVVTDSINGKIAGGPPWVSWGPYLWANGLNPRGDGTVWSCQDYLDDGTHPGSSGREKVSQKLLNFFKTDSTSKPWFLK